MNINPLSKKFNINLRGVSEKEVSPDLPTIEDKELIMKELDKMSRINSVAVKKAGDYEITIMYSAYGRDFMKFNLPISIQKKDFISETEEYI